MSNGYTDKVLEHFRNPHNMGKMENPDGVGKVGNPVCVTEGGFVHTNCNIKTLNEVSEKDRVIGAEGFYSKIKEVFFRSFEGEVLMIKNRFGKTMITSDHLVLAKRIPSEKDRFRRIKGKKEIPYGWFHASSLRKNDIVLYPIFKETEDIDYVDLGIEKEKFDFKSKSLPKKVPLNDSFLRFSGYYLSEGSLKDKTTKRFLMFTFNNKEIDLIEDVINIIKELWNLKVYIKRRKNVVNLIVNNTFLVRFVKKHFGCGAENKKIPDFIMKLPPRKQKDLIYALWKGDGYVNLEVPRAGFSTVSFQLASQLKLLLLRQKIIPSFYTEQEKTVKGVGHKRNYRLHIGDMQSLKNLFEILKIKYEFKSPRGRKVWMDDDFVYLPIAQIKRMKYKGRVYDLKVEKSHSFITDSLCLHNCGDVMWIYIKVKDNVIVDCKFETFGCVAAIATSSVLTDLVKGKTLEEAQKITNKDVAKELGGLPPIKMHCSLLAEEGIKAAIDDYLKRREKNENNS
jgi:nitrogen fixation NifU-like protein